MEEFKFDGFRFDGVTSMLYLDHGLSRDCTDYSLYYDGQQDEDAISYFVLANKLIHQIKPEAITIAEEMSGMPGIAASNDWGGFGFDYRMAMGIPDYWIKIIKEKSDEEWDASQIYYELISRRSDEKTINYCESHDQALVGDKTIIFRLLDKEMYFSMNKESNNLTINRGMALHKMIRLITLTTSGGGYLNFMGNEFGHPDWIDFPRKGNNWSYKYARRQWSLVDNKALRYHQLNDFDKEMVTLIKNENFLFHKYCHLIIDNKGDQVIAFSRGDIILVFNFNPTVSYTDYGLVVEPGKYKIILNTDSEKFGGFGLVNEHLVYRTVKYDKASSGNHAYLYLYLPSRTALVLKKIPVKSIY